LQLIFTDAGVFYVKVFMDETLETAKNKFKEQIFLYGQKQWQIR
jgi:hypothetical protein